MADPRGFLKLGRKKASERPVAERVRHFHEFVEPPPAAALAEQASRCMDCGVPFCHQGCPLGNLVPEWNDLVWKGSLDLARARLLATNNFPEITGRVCPAPCEASCVLALEGEPVTIKDIERAIADTEDFAPVKAARRTGRRVAVVGSGPAGLAGAQELARRGHDVVVYERDAAAGGLLRYGIPDFKLEKGVIDRRVAQLEAEGVRFSCGVDAASPAIRSELRTYDAVLLAVGARRPRDLEVPGRALAGVHFAMDYLTQQNRRFAGEVVEGGVDARGKRVVVIGGGDTGSDCVGTAIRQGAARVTQLEIMPRPPDARREDNPWPEWPLVFRTSSSQEEGCDREFAVKTVEIVGAEGRVTGLSAVRVTLDGGRLVDVAGSAHVIEADLVLLAMGFTGPEASPLYAALGVDLDARGNVAVDGEGRTSAHNVYCAGDASRGQSLVVWAIADGRRAAHAIDRALGAAVRPLAVVGG